MSRLMTGMMFVALTCLGLVTADAWANQGFPPKNLPNGSAWLPGPSQTMMLEPRFLVRPYEKPRSGPFTLRTPPFGGNKPNVTPIPIPSPRSTRTLRQGTLKLNPQPITLPNPPLLRLAPRPTATPMPLP